MARELPARASKPVLVVSGDDAAREAHLVALRGSGCSAIGVSSCDDALRVAARLDPCVVLFDVVNTADWFHCRRLREAVRDVPVVVLGAICTPDRWYRAMAQRIGCSGFVMKPCAPDS